MILQALYQLAQREGLTDDPDFEPKPVAWLVRVGPDGRLLGIEDARFLPPAEGKRKPKLVAKPFSIPKQPTGRSGTKAPACFFVDNAKYVFGIPTKDKTFSTEDGRQKAGWFRDKVAKCAKETGDEAAVAVSTFVSDVASGRQTVELPDDCKSYDLFAFVYAPDIDQLVHERPRIREYWKRQRLQATEAETLERWCLVTGQPMGEPGLFPLIEKVPGSSPSRIGLVSFNKPAFTSYGWEHNENAPISRDAAESCATALNRLLHRAYPNPRQPETTMPRRNLRLSADTAVCFWTAEQGGDEFCSVFSGLLEANPDEVKELYQSLWRGKATWIEDPSAFYALTLSGAQGRVIVRDWFESTVAVVAANLATHFADLDIVRNTPKPKDRDLPPQIRLTLLLEAIAEPAENRRKGVPAPLSARFIVSALGGRPYPLAILQRALLRFRCEIGKEQDEQEGWRTKQWNDARAALIKAVLNRRRRFFPQTAHYKEVQPHMDPSNMSEGYTLGRLIAVLERLQQEAVGNVNASVVDRYFSAASASPRSVFVRLLKNARHHVRKAMDVPERGGFVFRLDKLVDELAEGFDPNDNGFPSHLDLEQQGLFVLGYHQMRKWLWMSKEERADWEKAHAGAPRAYLWGAHKAEISNRTKFASKEE